MTLPTTWPLLRSLLRYHAGRRIPDSLANRIRQWERRRMARRRKAAKHAAIVEHGTFDATELVAVLREAGVREGGVVFAQCSFNDLFTFSGTPLDVVGALRATVGPAGTLLMPAYTANPGPSRVFDVLKQPTYTGVVPELFRRSRGVQRSLHPRHSICGEGALASSLLAGHELCERADGPGSPFDRLRLRDDAFIVALGLGVGFFSFLHWVEDVEPVRLPFPVHDGTSVRCEVKDVDGRAVVVTDWPLRADMDARVDYGRIAGHLTPAAMRYVRHRGVGIGVYPLKTLAAELLSLRDRGIIHYT